MRTFALRRLCSARRLCLVRRLCQHHSRGKHRAENHRYGSCMHKCVFSSGPVSFTDPVASYRRRIESRSCALAAATFSFAPDLSSSRFKLDQEHPASMDKFLVTGGRPLEGTIHVSGAKNSALPCMAAAILTDEEVILENIPHVRDIDTERKLLSSMGAEVESTDDGSERCTKIRCAILSDPVAKYEIVKTMRASSLVLGPLIARTGMARVAMPGGCAIGGRPIDLHIKGLEKMGATIVQEHGYLEAHAERLHGAHLVFDKITVTGTEDLLMAAVLAEGETLMENCAREPEVDRSGGIADRHGSKDRGRRNRHHPRARRKPAAWRALSHQSRSHRGRDISDCGRDHRRRSYRGGMQSGTPGRSDRQARRNRRGRRDLRPGLRSRLRQRPASRAPISPPRSILAFPPTCRRNTWRLPPRPTA